MNEIELKDLWRGGVHPASFSGQSLYEKHTGAKRSLLREQILPQLHTYTTFRVAKRPKVYNPYFTRTRRSLIQSDLIFMDQPPIMVQQNRGFRYVLIVQDIFSRKIWARPLKTKRGEEVTLNLRQIFSEMSPFALGARFVTDRGTEYLNAEVMRLLDSNGLTVTHPSDGHASHVERANLSLQRLLFQRMVERGGTHRWTEYLPLAVNVMNTRYHRIIKMSPNQAEMEGNRTKVNEAMALYRQKAMEKELEPSGRKKTAKFKLGDMVRIQKQKRVFSRGYQPTFTEEVFKIHKILNHLPITMYSLTEWDGTRIEGNFYPEELTLVKGDVFKVERVLRRAIRGGVPSALVKWQGFATKYNSWVPLTDLQHE